MTGAGSGGRGPLGGSDTEDAEKCPVCLGVPAAGELAMPDSCCHVFCLRCLLTWAEMSPSCPVDRRPFSSIYRLDSSLSLVQVPVRRRPTPTEADSCSCRNPEQKPSRKSKPARRSRRQKTERTADANTRGLVRKCNDDDPSSLSRKKVKASECCTWSPSTCVSVTPTDIADPAWLAEDAPHDDTFEHCKAQVQHCPWLSSAAPIPADGVPRRSHRSGWSHLFPFGLISPSFTSTSPLNPSHFVFQGVVCAVTCPKGGEKRGGRSSTSKAPTKEQVSVPSRRSRRNSKISEETPTSDSKSPTQSSLSDSDSPAGQSNKPVKPSQAPAKRKGKRVTNRKAGGKRKAKRKNSSCPAASDEEEKEEESNISGKSEAVEQEDETKEQDLNDSEQQQADAECGLKEEQSGFNSADEQGGPESLKSVEQSDDEAQGQSSEEPQEKKADDRSCDLSCHSPGMVAGGAQSDKKEEETASPGMAGEQESLKRTSHSSDSEDTPLKDFASPQSDEHMEQEDNMEICVPSGESSTEESSKEPKVELYEVVQSGLLKDELEENVTNSATSKGDTAPKCGTSPNGDVMLKEDTTSNGKVAMVFDKDDISPNGVEIMVKGYVSPKEYVFPKGGDSHEEGTSLKEEDVILKGDTSPSGKDVTSEGDTMRKGDVSPKGDASPNGDTTSLKVEEPTPKGNCASSDNGTSKDDTNVPMDCSSPLSEHGNDFFLNLPSMKASSAVSETLATVQNTQVTKVDSASVRQEREGSQERKNDKQRRSRFHSATSTWSPQRDSKREPSRRSQSRDRDGSAPSSRSSQARSRDRDRDGERAYSRRNRSRDRRRRRSRSRSRSKSRSRSRSRSRTRSYRRGSSPERAPSKDRSPPRKERRCGWKTGGEGGSGHDGRRYGGPNRFENGLPPESSVDRQGWSENPDWVIEKTRAEDESRSRDSSFSAGSRWEDQRRRGGELRGRVGRGGLERGGGNRNFYSQQEEVADSRWQPRTNFSGTGNSSGNDSYSRFNDNRCGGRKKESESGESMVDRSGWSSASSWAIRRNLPADVQDYYSKRERGGSSSWNRQEEEQQPTTADPPTSDPPPPPPPLPQVQVVPGNAPVALMNVLPPQLNVLHHHQYPIQSLQGPLPVTLQPAAPFAMPPQVPMHLHHSVPLIQVPAVGAQGLPPPPPPPPPMQAGSQLAVVSAQPDGHTAQMVSAVIGYGKSALLLTPTKGSVGQPASSQVLPSSTTQPSQHSKAQADSSKKEKKQQIQEKAINEVKTAIKPFYQQKEITKEEYKEIVRKAVEKVCHSKSREVNSSKVANLVKAYVDKYKHARNK